MNERLNKLDALLSGAWEQAKSAVQGKDRTTTQSALDKIAHIENLKKQELALEQSIAASLSNDLTGAESTETKDAFLSFLPKGRKRSTVRPKEVKIGSCRKQIRYAYEIPMTIANWLTGQGKAIPTLPNFVHPSDTGFASSAETKKLASGQFIEIGDHQEVLLQKGRKLLDACGCRGLKFEVLFEDGKTAIN